MATEITGELGGDIVDAVQGNLPKAGGTMAGDTLHGDNVKAKFGTGNDLAIYHDGANSYIKEAGTGDLIVLGNNVQFRNTAFEYYLTCNTDAGVTAYYNNEAKLATTSTGIDVTGGLNTTGNVGIGTSSPTTVLQVEGVGGSRTISGVSANMNARFRPNSQGGIEVLSTTSNVYLHNMTSGGSTIFSTRSGSSDYERMRIDSSGSVLIGTTATGNAAYAATIQIGSGTGGLYFRKYDTSTNHPLSFRTTSGAITGGVSVTETATSFNTSSDYRLKTDVKPMTNAIATFKQLKPCNFEWIADGSRVDGFIAHELQEVIPCAATGIKDAMRDEEYEVTPAEVDEEGNETTPAVMGTRSVPDMQGIDQAKVVPLLTAALQEAIAEIESLETRLTALEDTP